MDVSIKSSRVEPELRINLEQKSRIVKLKPRFKTKTKKIQLINFFKTPAIQDLKLQMTC